MINLLQVYVHCIQVTLMQVYVQNYRHSNILEGHTESVVGFIRQVHNKYEKDMDKTAQKCHGKSPLFLQIDPNPSKTRGQEIKSLFRTNQHLILIIKNHFIPFRYNFSRLPLILPSNFRLATLRNSSYLGRYLILNHNYSRYWLQTSPGNCCAVWRNKGRQMFVNEYVLVINKKIKVQMLYYS